MLHLNIVLRISTPKIKPTINKLVNSIQNQKSYLHYLFLNNLLTFLLLLKLCIDTSLN